MMMTHTVYASIVSCTSRQSFNQLLYEMSTSAPVYEMEAAVYRVRRVCTPLLRSPEESKLRTESEITLLRMVDSKMSSSGLEEAREMATHTAYGLYMTL